MNVLRHAAAGLVALAACALAVSAIVALAAGVDTWIVGIYSGVALALAHGARRLRPRRRFVFARH